MSVFSPMLTQIKNLFKRNPEESSRIHCNYVEKQVCVMFMQQCVTVANMRELFNIVRNYLGTIYGPMYLTHHSIMLFKRGKMLNPEKSLAHYSWEEYNQIDIRVYALFGGARANVTECDKQHAKNMIDVKAMNAYVKETERQCLLETGVLRFQLQTAESESETSAFEFAKMCKFINKHIASVDFGEMPDMLVLYENLLLTWKISRKCTEPSDYVDLACVAYKLFTGKSYTRFVADKWNALFTQVQAGGDAGDILRKMRGMMDFAESVGENPFFKKVTGLYSYLLVQGFLTRLGLTLSDEDYSRMEQRALNAQFSSRKGLWMSVLDVTLFICERIHEWKLTGDLSGFLHSSSEYTTWMKEADRLLALAPFTGNLAAHNTTYFTFLSDLNEAIERGDAYCKFNKKAHDSDVVAIKRRFSQLQLLKNTEVTKRSAQKERQAPFGVLVYGESSVGKSTFSKMLYYYYGTIMGLEKDDHYRYVRSPADEYWSNFDSSMWCVHLDDIAFMLPKKTPDIDPTLKELLNINNNVSYVPPQADLADKGKTPVLAKLLTASSNSKNLNAGEYFWCPLAVQRRLPYVVDIKPKPQYLQMNQKFLDPTKLPTDAEGYPDYWIITVKKVVPYFDGERDHGILEEVQTYTNVNDFLQDFGRNALAHEGVQEKAMYCDNYMKDVEVCVTCHKPGHKVCAQLQSAEDAMVWLTAPQLAGTALGRCFYGGLWAFYCWTVQMSYIMRILRYVAGYQVCRGLLLRWAVPAMSDSLQMTFVGAVNGAMTAPRKWKLALGVFTALTAGMGLYLSLRKSTTESPREEPVEKKEVVEETTTAPKMEQQGNVFSTTEHNLAREERSNVWYNPTLELSKFDVPLASQSLSKMTPVETRDHFANNCVRLLVTTQNAAGVSSTRSNAGVFLKGHFCLTNNHAFRQDATLFRVTIIKMNVAQGLSSNLTFSVRQQDLIRRPDTDLVLFDVRAMPPHKDITKFWDFNGGALYTRAVVLRRAESGELEHHELFNLSHCAQMPVEDLGLTLPISLGMGPRDTKKGDCGAIGVAVTPRGPVIFGLHIIGYGNTNGLVCVKLELLEEMMAEHEERFGSLSQVQGGGGPKLEKEGKPVPVTVPHYKSLFRYLPEGTLNVYGSFSGFRPQPRSGVTATPLQAEMLEHFGCGVNHGKPAMQGWEPWRKNVVEMVNPTVNYHKGVLAECVKAYGDDILAGLPQGWEGQLVFLSRRASVNGLPGVRFVDKLNTNTSMGFPWNCTKKRYLHADIDEFYPEGVDFDEGVWERVEEIEKLYAEGKRAFPVFTGHLKDEPTVLAKVEAKKTRVFTGGPVDWSIVVRSRLLTFIKLLQENRFLFEAGPGTVCQSTEWGEIHDYLTTFGNHRIVAGDYGKFDKRMIADFILAAYSIIARVYEAAGFEPNEVRQIMCIGTDTAFPVVNFNGDLVEFYGTNPSGHPLTVIINSLVNSLYMRYCYTLLNPEHECASFKENVHLFTYGDDNIMGVSKDAEWFNHTAIQRELAMIGVEYTMADKESETIPFINIENCQFLKRMWRMDPDVKEWLCPLEPGSIHKSLTTWVPSKTIDEYAQMVAVISSANSEFFFYGRPIFQKHHDFFKTILEREPYSHYVGTGTLPSWEQLVDRFNQASGKC